VNDVSNTIIKTGSELGCFTTEAAALAARAGWKITKDRKGTIRATLTFYSERLVVRDYGRKFEWVEGG
jgi:hypothetical protein